MLEREEIVTRLWKMLSEVPGVERVARNPINPPSEDDFPCINFFEFPDIVIKPEARGRTRRPVYRREFTIVVECFVKGSTENAATTELTEFVQELKKVLYLNGVSLGLRGLELAEKETGPILRPPGVEAVAGIGIVFALRYTEDTSKLFI